MKTLYINYVGGIDLQKVKTIMAVVSDFVGKKQHDKLVFNLSSPGGSVDAGIALYSFLKSLPVHLHTHNIGSIDSIANVIFLAGATRTCTKYSTFHFHGVKGNIAKDSSMGIFELEETLSQIKAANAKIATVLSSHTSIKKSEIVRYFESGQSKNADFAKERGIVHDICELNIPADADFVTINV